MNAANLKGYWIADQPEWSAWLCLNRACYLAATLEGATIYECPPFGLPTPFYICSVYQRKTLNREP